MITGQVLLWIMVAYGVYAIYRIIKAIKDKRVKYELKMMINAWRLPLTLIIGLCVLLCVMVIILAPFAEKMAEYSIDSINTENAWVYPFSIMACYLCFIYFYVKSILKSSKPWIAYTEQEKQWNKESKEKWANRWPETIRKIIMRFG